MVAADDDASAYVRRLEATADDDDVADMETVTGDALADELEKFLRDQRGE